ncbi:Hsp20/alpha crystallin family protein [Glycomyces sp. TRM65418]|uniref:Hsp20/alpha crystallin family protein n=1 Tax=Glycomyces sp. TRM65418 TaxID=2867006 RepID=UPI001CE5D5A1|nr:Hsp20/alpha crystallin family protein [Glycomyces sp. TRM65418]MCC3761887.1 Hsp20/alpha crystallin family protein [Glycomyces sp. TRM65418]QZD55967.1 Hsp20/alpha crystallin family protein [Glycomyces sp. TRM65418]
MIVRYQHPYAAFRQFDREFERLVRAGFGQGSVQYTLRADVYTEGEDLVVTAAVPGVSPEDVTVELEGRRLSITAERRRREAAEGDRYLVRGLAGGTFRREFTLPEGTTAEQLSAEVADGLLTVRVAGAVKPAPQPQRIPVNGVTPAIEGEAAEATATE